jgi:hypothetical protein
VKKVITATPGCKITAFGIKRNKIYVIPVPVDIKSGIGFYLLAQGTEVKLTKRKQMLRSRHLQNNPIITEKIY